MRQGTRGVAGAAFACAFAAALVLAPASGGASAPTDVLARAQAPARALVAARPLAVPGGGAIERYRQKVGGLPVLNGEATVARPRGLAPILVVDHTVAGIEAPAQATLGRGAAIEAATEAGAVERLRGNVRAKLFVDPKSERVVWRVLIPSAQPLADLSVLVDARSGEATQVDDLLKSATASASVFDPNPVTTQSSHAGLKDAKDKDSTLLTNLRLPVTLERITSTTGCLSGTHVAVRLGQGKKAKPVCSAGFDFSGVTRSQNAFEAVMTYFHIDRTRAYIDSLGLTRGLRVQPQKANVNGFTEDNSYFTPLTRKVAFGTGGVDDAEDADVIIHEYGHSLQDQAVHFFGEDLEGGSMGEGFGDYLAAVMSSFVTGGSATYDPCVFEWDATSYTKNACGRRTDTALTYERALARCFDDPHCIGRAWSGALWDLRGELATDTAGLWILDRVVLQSHFMLDSTSNFRDGARALLAADKLLYGGAHVPAIKAEMVQRGFLK